MRVSIICATTLCGRIGPSSPGSRQDRKRLEAERLLSGAGLLGAGTLRAADPEMKGPGGEFPPGRMRAIISASGAIPVAGRSIFEQGPRPVVFTGHDCFKSVKGAMAGKADVIPLPPGPGGLSLKAALDFLENAGVERLLIEGGGGINYTALLQGVVDDILLTITPRISGRKGSGSLVDGPAFLGSPFMDARLVECAPQEDTGELFLRYALRRDARRN